MEDNTQEKRQTRLKATRLVNSLIVNMAKCEDIIMKLALFIGDEDEKHKTEDSLQAASYIDRQIATLQRYKEAYFTVGNKSDSKPKKAA